MVSSSRLLHSPGQSEVAEVSQRIICLVPGVQRLDTATLARQRLFWSRVYQQAFLFSGNKKEDEENKGSAPKGFEKFFKKKNEEKKEEPASKDANKEEEENVSEEEDPKKASKKESEEAE